MRLRRLLARRHLLLGALVGAAMRLVRPNAARADFFGGDLPLLTGILAEATSTVGTLGTMLTNLEQELAAAHTMLSALDSASFDSLLGFLSAGELSYTQLTDSVTSIGYTLQSIQRGFRALYSGDYARVPLAQFDALYNRWQSEILAASEVAERAQTTLSTLEHDASAARAVLARSAASSGEVAQLQSVVQMLGLMQSQTTTFIQTMATTGRVLSAAAASGAAERQLSREKKRRNLANYTSRGPSVPPMRMP